MAGVAARLEFEDRAIELSGARQIIGRGASCDLQVDVDKLSKEHAMIWRQECGWIIRDLQSTNGTHVGDVAATGPIVLRSEDVIHFGRLTARFVDPEHPEPRAVVPKRQDAVRESTSRPAAGAPSVAVARPEPELAVAGHSGGPRVSAALPRIAFALLLAVALVIAVLQIASMMKSRSPEPTAAGARSTAASPPKSTIESTMTPAGGATGSIPGVANRARAVGQPRGLARSFVRADADRAPTVNDRTARIGTSPRAARDEVVEPASIPSPTPVVPAVSDEPAIPRYDVERLLREIETNGSRAEYARKRLTASPIVFLDRDGRLSPQGESAFREALASADFLVAAPDLDARLESLPFSTERVAITMHLRYSANYVTALGPKLGKSRLSPHPKRVDVAWGRRGDNGARKFRVDTPTVGRLTDSGLSESEVWQLTAEALVAQLSKAFASIGIRAN